MTHKPVLLREVLELLGPKQGENFIDATVNGGGHAKAILRQISPSGRLLGIDCDCNLIGKLREATKENLNNLVLECDNYANLRHIVAKHNFGPIAGILADLGFSSHHLEESGRGFSFLKDEPLDMRYGGYEKLTAEKIVNTWPREAIEDILWRFGEERYARRIANGVLRARTGKKITTTRELTEVIRKSVPGAYGRGNINPATRTFQALRIAVNRELENLSGALPEMISLLAPKGKVAIISFHSLEDRIVKNFFKEYEKRGSIQIISKKPVTASLEEKRENPRARSAKLRVAEKLSNQ